MPGLGQLQNVFSEAVRELDLERRAARIANPRLRRVAQVAAHVASYPAHGLTDVLGIGQRGISGLLSGPPDVQGLDLSRRLGAAGYEMVHPSQQAQFTEQLKAALHIAAIDRAIEAEGGPAAAAVPLSKPLQHALVNLLVETGTDPLTYVGGLGAVRRGGLKLYDVMAEGLPRALVKLGPAGHQIARVANVASRLKAGATRLGRAAAQTGPHEFGDYVQRVSDQDIALLRQPAVVEALQKGEMPEEVQRAQMRRAWLEAYQDPRTGDSLVRNKLLEYGYEPTDYERSLPGAGVLGDVRQDYFYEGPLRRRTGELVPGLGISRVRRPSATYAKPKSRLQTAEPAAEPGKPSPLYQQTLDRFERSDVQLMGPSAAMGGKAIILQRTAPMAPDEAGFAQRLAAARARGDAPEIQKIIAERKQAKTAYQMALADQKLMFKPGTERMSIGRFLRQAANPQGWVTRRVIAPQAFVQATRNLGLERKYSGFDIGYMSKPRNIRITGRRLERLNRMLDEPWNQNPKMQARITRAKLNAQNRLIIAENYNKALRNISHEAVRLIQRELSRSVPLPVLAEFFRPREFAPKILALRNLSDAYRLALFVNFVKHGLINIPTLQALGPAGFTGALHGIIHGLTMNKAQLEAAAQEVERVGAGAHYVGALPGESGVLGGLRALARPGTQLTQRFDIAQRYALLKYMQNSKAIAPEFGIEYRKLKAYQMGQLINDTLFDYRNQSELVQTVRGFGAPFPHWHLTLIAHVMKAALTNPRAALLIARTEDDLNRAVFQGKGYHAEFNLPLNEPIKAIADPLSWAAGVASGAKPTRYVSDPFKYLEATMGGMGNIYQELTRKETPRKKLTDIERMAFRTFMPFGETIEQLADKTVYKQYGPKTMRVLLSLLGGYIAKGHP